LPSPLPLLPPLLFRLFPLPNPGSVTPNPKRLPRPLGRLPFPRLPKPLPRPSPLPRLPKPLPMPSPIPLPLPLSSPFFAFKALSNRSYS
jgi:hypothetical protein